MNKSQTQSNLSSLVNTLLIILSALMPLFFLPTTTEFFEFNKLVLLLVIIILMLIAWGGKVIVSKKLSLAKSSMDVPIILMTGVFILSSVFSTNKVVSFFGSQGRWFPSLLGFLAMVVFYYVVTSNVDSKETIKKIMLALIGSSTLASILSIMSYYGTYLGNQPYFQVQTFTTTGSTTTAAIIATLALLAGYSLSRTEKGFAVKAFLGASIIINLFMVILSGFIPLWVTLVLGVIATVVLNPIEQHNKTASLALAVITAGLIVLAVFPATRSVIFGTDYVKEIKLPIKESWVVASSTVRDFPLLGTGPSTFYSNFTRYRTAELNNTNFWSISFDKPYNELFCVLSCLGIIGIVVAFYFGIKVIKFCLGNRLNNEISFLLALVLLVSMATFLFSYATVLTTYIFFLLLALNVANNNVKLREVVGEDIYFTAEAKAPANTIGSVLDNTNSTILRVLIATPLFGLAVAGAIFTYKMYPSEYYMRKAILAAAANEGSETYRYQALAINSNTKRASYRDAYAQTNLALVRAIVAQGNLTDTDNEAVQTLLSQALRNAQISTELLDPTSARGWETRAGIYTSLIGAAEDAHLWAIASLERAIQLDPNNPRLRLDIGRIYYTIGDYISAASRFRQATILKGDYANAYYNFALSLKQLEDYENAKRIFEATQTLLQPGTPDYELVAAELQSLTNLPSVAGATTKPTVEDLTRPEEQETTEQEPLTNVGEETLQELVIPEEIEEEAVEEALQEIVISE